MCEFPVQVAGCKSFHCFGHKCLEDWIIHNGRECPECTCRAYWFREDPTPRATLRESWPWKTRWCELAREEYEVSSSYKGRPNLIGKGRVQLEAAAANGEAEEA